MALAIPHGPQPFTETLLKVKACRHYLPPNEAEKISAQTESRLRDIFENPEDGYLPAIRQVLRDVMEGNGSCWYWQNGKVLMDKPKQSHKPADMLCEELFKKRSRIKHPDLNFCHDDKWRTGKNTALKQAVSVLLEAEKVLIDNGNPDNHGEKRYLEKVFLKGVGALRKTGSEGLVNYFECETDPAKINDELPAFKELCTRLSQINPGQTFSVGSFLEDVQKPPYGVGGTPLILMLGYIIRAYGERLIIYKDSTCMIEYSLRSYDEIVKTVADPAAKAVFVIRDISKSQSELVSNIAKAVNAPPLKHGEIRTLNSTFEALKQWWQNLPMIAKVISLYDKERQKRLTQAKELLDGLTGSVDRFDVLLEQFPTIYSGTPVGDAITEKEVSSVCKAFAEDVKLLNMGEQIVRGKVADAICKIFGKTGDMIECENVVRRWHEGLNPSQRDPHKSEHEEATHFLTRMADQSVTFDTKIMKLLPNDYGFGAISDWSSLHIKDYISKLTQAKSEIDKAKPDVSMPDIEEKAYEVQEQDKLYVEIPKGASRLLYTTDGSDPRNSDNRQQSDTKLDLISLLNNFPNVKVKLRAADSEGNMSGVVSVELISKQRKYEIQVKSDLFEEEEAIFKCPNDKNGLLAVLKSVIKYGVKKEILSESLGKAINVAIDKLIESE